MTALVVSAGLLLASCTQAAVQSEKTGASSAAPAGSPAELTGGCVVRAGPGGISVIRVGSGISGRGLWGDGR